jgi:small-conductance mechanosensitive channel
MALSLQGLMVEFFADLHDPVVLWQIAVLGLCFIGALALSRVIPLPNGASASRVHRLGAGSARRVVFPLSAMLLLIVARIICARYFHVHLLSIAISLLGSLAGIRFAVYLLRLAFAPSGALAASERLIATVVWLIVALHLTGWLPEIEASLDALRFSIGKQHISVLTILQSAFWILLTVLLALWAGSVLEDRLMRAEGLHSSLRVVLARLGKALLVVSAVLVVLPLVGMDLTVLSVFGGALGVGLGLGLQKIVSNYVSGFIVLLDRSVRLGDWVTAGEHYGEVKRITTRYTVVRSAAGVEAIIPNDTLVTSTILNHTYGDTQQRLNAKVCVAYSSDLPKVLELLRQIALRHPRVLQSPEPLPLVMALGDNGVELELAFWIDDPERGRLNVASEIHLDILREFRAQGIEIPAPQREVFVHRSPTASAI